MRKHSWTRSQIGSLLLLASVSTWACSSDDKDNKGGSGGEAGSGGSGGAPYVYNPAADWTTLAYDLSSNYWNKAETAVTPENASSLRKIWTFDLGGSVHSTPLVVGQRAYLFGAGSVVAIDVKTGEQVWRNATIGSATMAYKDGTLYANDLTGIIRAIDANTGEQRWATRSDQNGFTTGFSAPIVSGDYVLVGGSSREELDRAAVAGATFRGFILALNRSDGSIAWKKYTVEPPSNGVGIWSTLSVDETAGVVYAGTGNNYTGAASDTSDSFLAYPLHPTGEQPFLWKRQIWTNDVFMVYAMGGNPDSDFGANPVLVDVGGRKLALGGAKSGRVWAIDRTDGSQVAQRAFGVPNPFKGGVFNNGAWDGKHFLVAINDVESTGPGSEAADQGYRFTLFALDPLTLDVVWERQLKGVAFSPITVANGVGFIGKDTTLQVFNTETGKVLLEVPTEGTITTAPVVSNGRVLFGSGMQWIQAHSGSKVYALALPFIQSPIESDAGETDAGINYAEPTLKDVMAGALTQTNCGGPACHSLPDVGGFQLTDLEGTYKALVNQAASGPKCGGQSLQRVVPGSPNASLLYKKLIDPPPCGDRMPVGPTPLSADKIELVRKWIARGAPKQ